MKVELIVAIIGIGGVFLGALSQYLFSKHTEAAKHFQELRTKSYVDFIRATAEIAITQKKQDSSKEYDAMILLADARARIAIYGSPLVARAAANFFRKYGTLTSPESFRSYIAIVSAMRADSPGGKSAIPNIDVGQLILSEDIE